MSGDVARFVAQPCEADVLLDGIEGAVDDAERATLLAAAPEATRRQLRVRLQYRRFIEVTDREGEAMRRKLVEFTAVLEAATDDAARLAIIGGADPKFLAEWRWCSTATADIRRKRYLAFTA